MKGAEFMGADGRKHPYYMGCYGIGVGRTLSTVAELYSDEKGLRWPEASTPFSFHLIAIGNDAKVLDYADKMYQGMMSAGRTVLFDDRDVSAGVKFSDADLLGIAQRIVVSKRLVEQNRVELYSRFHERKEEIERGSFVS